LSALQDPLHLTKGAGSTHSSNMRLAKDLQSAPTNRPRSPFHFGTPLFWGTWKLLELFISGL